MTAPTVAEVDAIGAIADPVIRNLRITQCYCALSSAVAERASPGANWCTFATWASRQAGQTIRGEDVARALDDMMGSREIAAIVAELARVASSRALTRGAVVDAIGRAVEAALRRAASAVAAGNRKVFVEIGREFARWCATVAAAGAPDEAATAAYCESLRPGEPPDGQRLLREAFVAYGAACRVPEARERAEMLLLGNLLVGLHEQTRLQPEIQASLDAAIDPETLRSVVLPLVLPGAWLRLRARIARWIGRPMPADRAIGALAAALRPRVRGVLTDWLMTLRLPGTVLHLGRDLSGPFPPDLQVIEHAPLRALLASIDPTPDATTGSGATDWANLAERMHFIADLFRCWHARAELFTAPYTPAQIAEMRAGRLPAGDL